MGYKQTLELGKTDTTVTVKIVSNGGNKRNNLDDGPPPKKDFRKVNRRLNAQDQFKQKHDSVTEKQTPRNIKKIIEDRNSAVPTLDNELKKKKSITTVTTIDKCKIPEGYDWGCSACAQLLTYKHLKKLQLKPKCAGKESLKPKYRCSHAQFRCTGLNNEPGRRSLAPSRRIWSAIDSNHTGVSSCVLKKSSQVSKKTNLKITNLEPLPPNRDPSVSSYNSFLSADHEPMD